MLARTYFCESISETEPARLQDASTLLMYANGAVRLGWSSLTPAEISDWNSQLTSQIQNLVSYETPHRRASLLYALGYLGLHPVLTEDQIQDLSGETRIREGRDPDGELSSMSGMSFPPNIEFTNESQTLAAWTELADNLEETPLFPIQTLADVLQLLMQLWSTQAEWRDLLDRVDEAVGKRLGKTALAGRARDRAMMLLQADRRLDALEEFHRAKIDWWSGETVRGSLLAMIIIARLYFELRLPQASKSYALAVSYIAASRRDEALADLIPAGLLMAARADFVSGAWSSATELYELGLEAQYQFIEDGIVSERHTAVDEAVLHLGYISACAKTINSELANLISVRTARTGVQDNIEKAMSLLNSKDKDSWDSFGASELLARPFADLGEARYIHFSALGMDWTLIAANDISTARSAERFASAAQVILAALAREDLCLIQTKINVHIQSMPEVGSPSGERIELLPSNDSREWVVRLAPIDEPDEPTLREAEAELFSMLTVILRDASLLPETALLASLERALEIGLGHKLSSGRPYDELVAAFAADTEDEIPRSQYNTPWECHVGYFRAHDELRWRDGQGPTYSRDKAIQLLQTRYLNLARGLRITVEHLASSEEFRRIVRTLRAMGWLDWHILAAVFNIAMNYRLPRNPSNSLSGETQREMAQMAATPESATAAPVPIGSFTLDSMNNHRQLAMMSLLNHWGLECHQRTPDIDAIERLLADRYGYWNDDVAHDDPFLDAN